jgi:transketolase
MDAVKRQIQDTLACHWHSADGLFFMDKFLKFNPKNPWWINRDRLFFRQGMEHASYSPLYLTVMKMYH